MIFAAGLGTRLRPLTNDKPKALVEVNGKPLLEIVIQRLKQYGFTDIVVNVHYFSEQIVRFLKAKNNFDINIQISDESDLLLETGGGLQKAKAFLCSNDEPFLVHNVDILSDINLTALYKSHLENKPLATLVVRNRRTSRYLLFDETNRLCGWKNVKTDEIRIVRESSPSFKLKALAFSGIHVLSPRIFDFMPVKLGKFSIIETYLKAAKSEGLLAYHSDDSQWLDVGKPESLEKAEKLKLSNGKKIT